MSFDQPLEISNLKENNTFLNISTPNGQILEFQNTVDKIDEQNYLIIIVLIESVADGVLTFKFDPDTIRNKWNNTVSQPSVKSKMFDFRYMSPEQKTKIAQ